MDSVAAATDLTRNRYRLREKRTRLDPWRTNEDRVLHEHYEQGGGEVCLRLLPHRTLSAIYCRARKIGLRAPRKLLKGKPVRRYLFTESIDTQIRQLYQGDFSRGALNDLCDHLMIPRYTIAARARKLGLITPRFREPDWTQAEELLLEEHAWKTPDVVSRIFKKQGFQRTATAISVRVKRLHLDTKEPGVFSAAALAKVMGVDNKTVLRWINVENLKATRRDNHANPEQGGTMFRVTEKDLRNWIRNHAQSVDLRKVDRFWFIELAFGPPRVTVSD